MPHRYRHPAEWRPYSNRVLLRWRCNSAQDELWPSFDARRRSRAPVDSALHSTRGCSSMRRLDDSVKRPFGYDVPRLPDAPHASMGNSVSRATRSRSACRWISTAISRCVWLACTTLSAILEPALDRLVLISPSSFNTDAMPVWIAFTTALEADCTALTTHPSHAAWACTGIHSRAAAVKDAMDARFFIEISVLSDPSCRVAL